MKYNYLANFIRRSFYNDFCLGELKALTETFGKKLFYDENYGFDPKADPVIKIHIDGIEDTDIAEKICERAILTNYIIKVKFYFFNFLIYSEADTFEDLVNNVNREEFKHEIESEKTFKMFVDARGRVASQENKLELINKFGVLNWKGKINLKAPERTFVIVDNFYKGKKYFGRLIAGKSDDPLYYSKYNLPGRKYLGPTTTDNILAFIMCNLGRINAKDCVLDPFVGTGSLLIPPSHFGALTYGSDIDIRVLKGYGIGYTKKYTFNFKESKYNCNGETKINKGDVDYSEKSNIFTNFVNYDLPFPQIIRSDINSHNIRHCEFFDAIVCDPPYGQRAFTKKSGLETHKKEKRNKRLKEKYADFVDRSKKNEEKPNAENQTDEMPKEVNENEEIEDEDENENEVNEEEFIKEVNEKAYKDGEKENSFKWAPLKHCPLDQIFKNLMQISDHCVKKGGYMVCLYPFTRKKDEFELVHQPINFPRHDNFHLIEAIENKCTPLKSRWCLVYKKKE